MFPYDLRFSYPMYFNVIVIYITMVRERVIDVYDYCWNDI